MCIISQSLLSYLKIYTLSPSAPRKLFHEPLSHGDSNSSSHPDKKTKGHKASSCVKLIKYVTIHYMLRFDGALRLRLSWSGMVEEVLASHC